MPLWQTVSISGKKERDDCPQDASLLLRERLTTTVLKIISDAAVHSHATAFTRSFLQTEAGQPSEVLAVQQMSQLCPGFIAPRVLLFSSPSSFLVWIMVPFDLHAEACVLSFQV